MTRISTQLGAIIFRSKKQAQQTGLQEDSTVHIEHSSSDELKTQLENFEGQYKTLQERNLALDLTRGKPSADQLALSDALDGILQGNYLAADGTDTRNYGGLAGLTEARALFACVHCRHNQGTGF